MKVNSIKTCYINFKAGITNIFSDFDGTYMPYEFRHDSVVKNNPPLDKDAFSQYFDSFRTLLDQIKGKGRKPKLNFKITTGRNLAEFNYYMQKIKEQGLKIPLPDSVITCNGADEFLKNRHTDSFFKTDMFQPYLMSDINKEKIRWIRKVAGGWDGDKIREIIKKTLQDFIIIPNNKKRDELIYELAPKEGRHSLSYFREKLFDASKTEEEIRQELEKEAKEQLENMQGKQKDDYKRTISEVAHEIKETLNGQHRYTLFEAPTNQCSWNYPGNISLQSQIERIKPIPKFPVSIRQDGNLNFSIALPWVKNHRRDIDEIETEITHGAKGTADAETIAKKIDEALKKINLSCNISTQETNPGSYNIYGERTSAVIIRPYINKSDTFLEHGGLLDKMHDVERKAKEIVDKKTNDLIIVAGDGRNDLEALDLKRYANLSVGKFGNFEWKDTEQIKRLQQLPIISIFVKNKDTIKSGNGALPYQPYNIERNLNADGIVRYIIVDKNNPQRPHTLQEAVEIAVNEYTKRNPKFKENLSSEMLERITKNPKSYPVEVLVDTKKILEDTTKDTAENMQDITKENISNFLSNKKPVFLSVLILLGIGAIITLIAKSQKKISSNISEIHNALKQNNCGFISMTKFMDITKNESNKSI